MIDLSKRGQITIEEKQFILELLQFSILNSFSSKAQWNRPTQGAFHGGTSIRSCWGSPRYSEDLDFMVSVDERKNLDKIFSSICSSVKLHIGSVLPGSLVDCAVKTGRDEAEDIIDVLNVKWTHKNRIGKVLVKTEFYIADASALVNYETVQIRPKFANKEIFLALPVGTTLSLWADKLKAMATRPVIKWRDLHDLAALANIYDSNNRSSAYQNVISDESRIAALERTAAIYNKTLSDVLDGLKKRIDENVFAESVQYISNMSMWFAPNLYEFNVKHGVFNEHLEVARNEVERAVGMLEQHFAQGIRP